MYIHRTWDNAYNPTGTEKQWSIANLSIIHSAGWYDIFGYTQMLTALAVNQTAQINAIGNQILVIDPGMIFLNIHYELFINLYMEDS